MTGDDMFIGLDITYFKYKMLPNKIEDFSIFVLFSTFSFLFYLSNFCDVFIVLPDAPFHVFLCRTGGQDQTGWVVSNNLFDRGFELQPNSTSTRVGGDRVIVWLTTPTTETFKVLTVSQGR